MGNRNHLKSARRTIKIEAKGLENLSNNLTKDFNTVCDYLAKTRGKIITIGIGKSGHIAQKVSATLSSTGSPSSFINAAEALHGDAGGIAKNDSVLIFSHSGQSEEIIELFPFLKSLGCKYFSITGSQESFIAKNAQINIDTGISEEACPLDLAPTTSTTAALAIGDAIAISTMKQKKFGEKDFKKFHPSGSIGAKLKTVEDLMLKGKKIPFIDENTNMRSALKIITRKKLGVLVVQNKSKKTSGIITDGQIRRVSEKKGNLDNMKVKNVMTKKPVSVDKEILAAKALSLMNSKRITSLCVHNKKYKDKTVGILHIHNILENNIQ